MNPDNLQQRLQDAFPDTIVRLPDFRGEVSFSLSDFRKVAEVAKFLKKDCSFDYLVDISSVDHAGQEPRFEMVYEFYSIGAGQYIRLKTKITAEPPVAPTLCGVYATANWHEREIFDLMGISFEGHPDLRRILMWEGYPYHPLRKEFPLEGFESGGGDDRFTKPAPMEGGPFVTTPASLPHCREPRSKTPL